MVPHVHASMVCQNVCNADTYYSLKQSMLPTIKDMAFHRRSR